MQNLEKKTIDQFDVPVVKDRLFNRFMMEHSLKSWMIKDNHPQFQFTPLEEAGVMGRLAQYENDFGFSETMYSLNDSIELLAKLERLSHDPGRIDKALSCIQIQVRLLQLFEWLSAYGPKPKEV
jgi:hypothetical protein